MKRLVKALLYFLRKNPVATRQYELYNYIILHKRTGVKLKEFGGISTPQTVFSSLTMLKNVQNSHIPKSNFQKSMDFYLVLKQKTEKNLSEKLNLQKKCSSINFGKENR